MSESIFKKALVYLGLKDAKGEYPNKVVQIEVVNAQPNNCITNKLIYNVNTKKVIVITCDGDKYEGDNIEKEEIEALKTANVQEIVNILTPKHIEEIEDVKEEIKLVSKFLGVFDNSDDFDVVGEQLYFKGIRSTPIPHIIVARFIEILQQIEDNKTEINLFTYKSTAELNEEYNSLKMFTLKLLLNPVEEARQDALSYINQYAVKLTSNGNMIMFRRIVSVADTNKELVEFISKQYIKVKSWKKSPSLYRVFKEDIKRFIIVNVNNKDQDYNNCLGFLDNLYKNLPTMEENRYTDNHTGTYDIRIGQTYKINEIDIDTNKRGSCGGALHVTTKDAYDYSSFGDTPVCVIVSPQHIYKMDSGCSGKIGVKQMFIASVTTQNEEGDYEDIDNQALVNFDEYYHNENMLELETSLKQKSLALVSVDNIVSELSIPEVQNITELLKNRIVTI